MMPETLQFVELVPFDSFVLSRKSAWTFGLKELFRKTDFDLEIIVSEESKAETLRWISTQENRRGAAGSILQGVGGAGAGMGVMAAAGAAGACPACYPLYAAFAPAVGAVAGALTVPAIYITLMRLGQRKVVKSLEDSINDAKITVMDYGPFLEIASSCDLEMHMAAIERIDGMPRKQRDKAALKEHKLQAYHGLLNLRAKAEEMAQQTGQVELYAILAAAYGHTAKQYGKSSAPSLVILKPVQYKPIKKSSKVLAGVGAALLLTGGALFMTGTNPLDYVIGQSHNESPILVPVQYHTDSLYIDGMTCDACANAIERNLENSPAVQDATINLQEGTGIVIYDSAQLTHEQLLELMPDGYSATIQPHQDGNE